MTPPSPDPGAGEAELTVPPDAEGVRLDRFLAERAGLDLSRSRLQRLIREGRVEVEGRPARPSQPVRAGSRIRVRVPPPEPAAVAPQPIPLDVVYEDADLLVVVKPRGMVVHPAPGHPAGTLVNALLARCPDLAGVGGVQRPGLVHRLDRDTTGLLVVAKTDRAHRDLTAQLRRRELERRYLALVRGVPPAAGTVDAPVGRDPHRRVRMAVVPDGRPARTHFRLLEAFRERYALLEVRLETGRTHQIRVHLAAIGHPVAGDPLYGGRRGELGLQGQALHAYRLALVHPRTGEHLCFEAPPPPDLASALARLRRGETP